MELNRVDVDVASKNTLIGSEVKVYARARIIPFLLLLLLYFSNFFTLFLFLSNRPLILILVLLIEIVLFIFAVRKNSLPPLTIVFSLSALFLFKSLKMVTGEKGYDVVLLVGGDKSNIIFGWIMFGLYIPTILVFIVAKLTKQNKLILISYILSLIAFTGFIVQNIWILSLLQGKKLGIFGTSFILFIPLSIAAIVMLFFYIKNYKRDTIIFSNLIKRRLNKLRKK